MREKNEQARCPCGNPSGPNFRYGACDECAKNTPASVLLLWGQSKGEVAKWQTAYEREKARADAAERARDAWHEEAKNLEKFHDRSRARAEAAEAARAKLTEALRKYGTHKPKCNAFPAVSEEQIADDCDCGFIAALTGAASAPKGQ